MRAEAESLSINVLTLKAKQLTEKRQLCQGQWDDGGGMDTSPLRQFLVRAVASAHARHEFLRSLSCSFSLDLSIAQPAHLAGDSGPLPSPFSHSAPMHTKRPSHGHALQGFFVLVCLAPELFFCLLVNQTPKILRLGLCKPPKQPSLTQFLTQKFEPPSPPSCSTANGCLFPVFFPCN